MTGLQGLRIYIDANVFIYFLSGEGRHFAAAVAALNNAASGHWHAVTGDLVEGEVLVGTFRAGSSSATAAAAELFASPWLTVLPHRRQDVRLAARLRADSGQPFIDTLHVATAIGNGCDALLTNDQRLRGSADLTIVQLATLDT